MTAPVVKWVAPVVAFLGLLALWQVAVSAFGIPPAKLVSPVGIAREMIANPGYYLHHSLITFSEALSALVIALAFGFFVAVVFVYSSTTRTAFMPLVIAAQSVPLVAMGPLFAGWFGDGMWSKVITAAMLCWYPTTINATRGMLETQSIHDALFASYGASKWRTITRLRIPNAMTYVVAGVRISAGLAFIGAVVSEYGGGEGGLGRMVILNLDRSNPPQLFGLVVCACVAGLLLAEIAHFIASRLLARYLVAGRSLETPS